jgi:SNF2 family DNA or RNA helicase
VNCQTCDGRMLGLGYTCTGCGETGTATGREDMAIKTAPYEHQHQVYREFRDARYFGLFWEMGLGKTKVILDVASHLYLRGKIDSVLVLAPNSVYSNWIIHEVPQHLAVDVAKYRFRTKEKKDRDHLKRMMFLDPQSDIIKGRLRFAAMSYDSIRTDHGFDFAQKLVLLHRAMIVADESTALKNPKTVQAKRAKELASHCHYRWIATGTPVAQSPFDIHSQMEFLDPEFWKRHGIRSLPAFRQEYGLFETRRGRGAMKFEKVVGYRRLDNLNKIIAPISSRLLKEDSVVKLPPKVYTRRSFELSSEQRRVYEELKKNLIAEIDADPGGFAEAPLAVTRLMRLQQVCSGFVTATTQVEELEELEDGTRPVLSTKQVIDVVPPEENPRLKLLLEILESITHKVIIWCRFVRDVDIITNVLNGQALRYDGSTSTRDRERALEEFNHPNGPRIFVANVHAISMGVTLNIAKTAIYYTNSYSLERRLQSEDRFHRIGQDQSVNIIDIEAEDTVDEQVVEALRRKFDVASQVTGDKIRSWLTVDYDDQLEMDL